MECNMTNDPWYWTYGSDLPWNYVPGTTKLEVKA
jgi:hypothetical protein